MRYYQVTGETRSAILGILERRQQAHEECIEFAERFGANEYVHATGLSNHMLGLKFPKGKEPSSDDKLLKKYYSRRDREHKDWYVFSRRTRKGKELAQEMRRLRLPGSCDIGQLIGHNFFSNPGLRQFETKSGLRVVVVTSDDYRPQKKQIVKDLTRISDVNFEKMEEKYGEKKKSATKRKKS